MIITDSSPLYYRNSGCVEVYITMCFLRCYIKFAWFFYSMCYQAMILYICGRVEKLYVIERLENVLKIRTEIGSIQTESESESCYFKCAEVLKKGKLNVLLACFLVKSTFYYLCKTVRSWFFLKRLPENFIQSLSLWYLPLVRIWLAAWPTDGTYWKQC